MYQLFGAEMEQIMEELNFGAYCLMPNHLHAIVILDNDNTNNRQLTAVCLNRRTLNGKR